MIERKEGISHLFSINRWHPLSFSSVRVGYEENDAKGSMSGGHNGSEGIDLSYSKHVQLNELLQAQNLA